MNCEFRLSAQYEVVDQESIFLDSDSVQKVKKRNVQYLSFFFRTNKDL